jgi:diacylglycerol kinase (ATP)
MKFKVIVNPLAGRGFGARVLPRLERLLAEHGLDFDLVCTKWAGEAVELARQAVLDGYETVVAVGGDGTYQEVINGMIAASKDGHTAPALEGELNGREIGTLGIVPVGSGCDFAWSAGIPSGLEEACARLAAQQTRLVDLGKVTVYADTGHPVDTDHPADTDHPTDTNHPAERAGTPVSRYFDNAVGIGFDGIVTAETRKFKRLRGIALYLPVVLKTVFMTLKPARSVIEYEPPAPASAGGDPVCPVGEAVGAQACRLTKTVLMTTICNGAREGGGFFVAPDARNDDGLFDVCVADHLPRLQILGMIPHFLKGTHVDKPSVTMVRSKRIVITSPDPLIAHADGEILCTDGHRIECEIVPEQVRVIC